MLRLSDLQAELHARGGVEATGIRLTRDEFDELLITRGRPRDPLVQPQIDGKPAKVIGLPVTWVETPATPKLLPALQKRKKAATPAKG